MTVTFFVPGPPVPFTRVLRGSQQERAKRYRQYKRDVGWEAKAAGAQIITGPVCLNIDVYLPDRLKRRWDLDNVIKSVGDALQGICFENDKQITSVTARIYSAGPFGREVGVRVAVLEVT